MRSLKWSMECPKSPAQGIHYWIRYPDRTATCKYCALELSKDEADECFGISAREPENELKL